jgi:capsular polysaccharide transport system permease protein
VGPARIGAVAVPAPSVGARQAGPARLKRRHYGVFLSFFLAVILPALAVTSYLHFVARDQYASNVGFSVQREGGLPALDLLGGLTQIAGANTPDPVILYKYITSRDMITAVAQKVDLEAAFTASGDPWFSLPEGATIEDREDHWGRMVKVFLDSSSGLIEIRVRSFDPRASQAIVAAITDESIRLLNQLSETAKADATRYARADLDASTERLRLAREAMAAFRTRTQIVDPATDFAGRMGLLNSLIEQLATARIDRDLLLGNSALESDPRLEQINRRIEVITNQIAEERARISTDVDGSGSSYAAIVAEYEGLKLEEDFAQQSYLKSLANLDIAIATATRTTRYLAIYMPPTLPEKAEYPERLTWSLVILGMLFVLWSILVLTYYAVRDRR